MVSVLHKKLQTSCSLFQEDSLFSLTVLETNIEMPLALIYSAPLPKIWSTRASQIIPCTRQHINTSSEGALVSGSEVHKTTREGNTHPSPVSQISSLSKHFEGSSWRQIEEGFPQPVSISYWYSYSRGTNPSFASHLCQSVSVFPVYSLYALMAAVPLG